MKVKRNLWLSDPSQALKLDYEDKEALFEGLQVCGEALDMVECGWVHIGEADIEFRITKYPDAIMRDSLRATEAALKKLDADHEVKRNRLLDLIGKFQAIGWNGKRQEGDINDRRDVRDTFGGETDR